PDDATTGTGADPHAQRDHCPLRLLLHHYEQAPEAEFYQENIEWQLDDGQSIYGLLNSHRSEQTSGMTIYTGTLQDVTLQKRAEELQRARDLAEETARVREQVLANVSHELRTPMNAILGMNNLLATMDLTAEQRECTDYIREASQVLLGIINDILLTSSLQQGTVELELAPFDLPLTIRRIVELIKPKADAKRLRLAYHLPEQWPGKVVGDKQRLSQVLFNIVGNAIKFTEQGAVNLRVQCQAGEQADELEVLIEVEDTGPGIAPEQQEQIFQPFVRLKQAKQNIEGTGLGLNIAQQLIQHMGGTITLCSQLGVGTTFKINLPLTLATEPKEEPPNTRPAPRELGLKRLLVVEDHPMNQIVIRRTLEKEFPQLDIQLADSGEAALELVAAHDFDLILMDLQLPGMDGYQTATNIRRIAAGAYAHIPILAMTAQAQVSHDERYQQAGIADYILKPFDPQDLFAKLTQYT
ncbi:MAG: response regulator, partial [Bacteroidetes bacterium]